MPRFKIVKPTNGSALSRYKVIDTTTDKCIYTDFCEIGCLQHIHFLYAEHRF